MQTQGERTLLGDKGEGHSLPSEDQGSISSRDKIMERKFLENKDHLDV